MPEHPASAAARNAPGSTLAGALGDAILVARAWTALVAVRIDARRRERLAAIAWAAIGEAHAPPRAASVDPAGAAALSDSLRLFERALRLAPFRPTCLEHAIALTGFLARRGIDARLRIGARRTPAGAIDAHAWVEHEGRAIDDESAAFAALEPIPRHAPERRP